MTTTWLDTGVLVLGAGLAGLRAAWAAAEACPGLPVVVAGLASGPSGSSFANRNDALGMQVPDEDQAEAFVREVLALARPGFADEGLVRLLANEAEARFRDLQGLGLCFRRDPQGGLARFPGCFSQVPRAVIFENLAQAFGKFRNRVAGLGAELLGGAEVLGLLLRDKAAVGALFRRDGEFWAVRASAVVLALGGPAPLYGRDMSGPGNTGISYGLLAEAGAGMANAGYLQFLWAEAGSGSFCSPAHLLAPGAVLLTPDGGRLALDADAPEAIRDVLSELRTARATHCPAGYGLPDSALDELLLSHLWPDGLVRVERDGVVQTLGLFAHAGNGGALIDEQGRTTVPGLFACGECATGMHGANRLGGGMVLATQVFGARAGQVAAERAAGASLPKRRPEVPAEFFQTAPDAMAERQALARIRQGLQRCCLFGPRQGIEGFRAKLEEMAASGPGRRVRLMARAGLGIAACLRPC